MDSEKQCFIYARVSPTKKRKGKEILKNDGEFIALSLENQLKKCRAQSAVDDYIVVGEYFDEYISGKMKEYMKEFNKMLQDIDKKLKPGDRIYILRANRFGRNLNQMLMTEYDIRQRQIYIKSVEEGFDTSTSMGRLVMGLLASVAEWQREKIIDDTRRGWEAEYEEHPEKFGRPKKEIDWEIVKDLLNAKSENGTYKNSWSKIAKTCGVSRITLINRYKKEFGMPPARRL